MIDGTEWNDSSPRAVSVSLPATRWALLIGHPGHELHVHGWLGRTRPRVFVLTDGGGRREQPRLACTTQILEQAGAEPCHPYGRHSDIAIYQAVLDGRYDLFLGLIEELAAALVRHRITSLLADAADDYNPTHNICRLLAGAALTVAGRRTGRLIAGYELLPTGRPVKGSEEGLIVGLDLSDEEVARKRAAALGYRPLRAEIEAILTRSGEEALRRERFCPFRSTLGIEPASPGIPYYEQQGEQRVAAGLYPRVLRHRQHMVPLIEQIERYLAARRACAA
jgi:hypothetical protein